MTPHPMAEAELAAIRGRHHSRWCITVDGQPGERANPCDCGKATADALLAHIDAITGAVRRGYKAMDDRYHDLVQCGKDDDCFHKSEGVELAMADFDEETASVLRGTPQRPDTEWPEQRELASEYGRLLAERDRLIADGVDPSDLDMPLPPDGGTPQR